ncbi:MAG: hypothetical protein F2789_02325 [Actinobacteria bacterium]|nr:hypothetical protein [Actinomycetota bacterium]
MSLTDTYQSAAPSVVEPAVIHREITSAVYRAASTVGLLGIALIHVLDLPGKWSEARYLGIGYVLVIAAALALAEINATRHDPRALLAAAGLAALVVFGFVVNRTVGMPNASEDIGNWSEPLGLASLFVELVTLWVCLRAWWANHTRW